MSVPPPRIALERLFTPGARLGWNTWLTSQQPTHDVGDALFVAEEIVRVAE